MSGTCFSPSIICLFSQLHWVSVCQQLWGFALERAEMGVGEDLFSRGTEVLRGCYGTEDACVNASGDEERVEMLTLL